MFDLNSFASLMIFLTITFQRAFIHAQLEDNINNEIFPDGKAEINNNEDDRERCHKEPELTWCLPHSYDKEVAPWKHRFDRNESLPFYYRFKFIIREVQEIDDLKQTIKIDMYFIITWNEPRVIINDTMTEWEASDLNFTRKMVPVSVKHLNKLWRPDIEVHGMTEYFSGKILSPMASLKLSRKGSLRYGTHVILTISCNMDFKNYPLDSQECVFRSGSYNYDNRYVNCSSKLDFDVNEHQRHLQYNIEYIDLPLSYRINNYGRNEWAVCGFGIKLERGKSQIMFQVYLPSILVVIVSWISFNVNPSAIPARMGMLVLAFLVLINIFMSVKSTAPISTGLNAADIFLVACVTQVFSALLEYTLVLIVMGKKEKHNTTPTKDSGMPFKDNFLKHDSSSSQKEIEKSSSNFQWNLIDKISIFVFPTTFSMFVIFYYNMY